jgi:putative RNA 2'-phosphotransferase
MDYQKLSKEISYALRHAPWKYKLELDEEGWVEVNQLLSSLHNSIKWESLTETDLNLMIEKFDKKRHEIANGRIRAVYGHSVPAKIKKESCTPPDILYHGTSRRFSQSIIANGLLPMERQYVHLSVDKETALQVGKRRDDEPLLLSILRLKP